MQPDLLNVEGVWLTGEDNLRLTTIGALAGAGIAIEGRLIDAAGRVIPFAERHVPNSNYTANATVHQMREGMLTHVQLRVTAGAVLRGHVFATLELVRGMTGALQPIATLLQGYVTANARLAWPGSPIEGSTSGAGRLRTILGTDPAAGAEIAEVVPASVRWRLLSVAYTFVASAAAANREPVLTIDDGTNALWETSSGVAVTASQTAKYRAGVGTPLATIGTRVYTLPLPEGLYLAAGSRIRTVTAALDVGDNYGAPVYAVEEFIE